MEGEIKIETQTVDSGAAVQPGGREWEKQGWQQVILLAL